jgi:hypothetical protein
MPMDTTQNTDSFEFEMIDPTDNQAQVVLNCGASDIDCYFDIVSVRELVPNEIDKGFHEPRSCGLEQSFPNLFNAQTTIDFSLPTEQFVTLTVYDLRGREIKRLVRERMQSGNHSVTFEALSLPTGLFSYKLETDSQTLMNKMMLIR